MANPRYNTQVTQPRGSSARVGKMGGGMMRPMYKKGGRVKKMGGGRIAGAARRAQEHGYYTPDMGMKGGRMYRDGGKVGKKKPRVKVIGIGKAKDYPGIKKIIEMNKKGKKRFKDGGMTKGVKEDSRRDQMKQPLKTRSGGRKTNPFDPNKDPKKRATKGFKDGGSALKAVDKSKNPGLAKLPTQVRNKMGYMKDGGKVKSKGSGHPLAGREGNVKHKLKSQKELKKITDSDAYKKADYAGKTKMLGGKVLRKDGGMAGRRNTRRMNRLEELGRVDAERGFTRKGKKNLKAEKKRIVRELKK